MRLLIAIEPVSNGYIVRGSSEPYCNHLPEYCEVGFTRADAVSSVERFVRAHTAKFEEGATLPGKES